MSKIKKTKKGWYIDIVERKTKEVIHSIGPSDTHPEAMQVERGVHINMDHDGYRTEINER